MPHIFKTLPETGMASYCAGTDDPAALQTRLAHALEVGSVRPEWCWLALDRTGSVVARHYWWGPPGSQHPAGLDQVSAERHGAAVDLIAHARDQFEVDEAWCEVTAPLIARASGPDPLGAAQLGPASAPDQLGAARLGPADDPSAMRPGQVAVLTDSGFRFEVARVTVEWTRGDPSSPTPAPDENGPAAIRSDPGRLVFRPAAGLTTDLLVPLFVAVADGSLDHGMVSDRARFGAEDEARRRLDSVRSYRAEPDWFTVAFTAAGEPVGYVVPGLADDAPMVGEIGVAAAHRGRRYVDDLLTRATRLLAASGAERIVADTDRANTPMRAAFARGGYREVRWRDDYRWRRPSDQPGQTESDDDGTAD